MHIDCAAAGNTPIDLNAMLPAVCFLNLQFDGLMISHQGAGSEFQKKQGRVNPALTELVKKLAGRKLPYTEEVLLFAAGRAANRRACVTRSG